MEKKNARKKINEVIEVPAEINVTIQGSLLKLSKNGKEVSKELEYNAEFKDNKIILEEGEGKKEKKLIKTTAAHIRNLLYGLENPYVYKLQICSVHFPMNVTAKDKELIIKNFLGEVKERKAKLLDGVDVKIEKDIITLKGNDKEKVGQTAANIEKATRIRNRDRKVFQDGIYITEKQKGARR